MFSAHGHPPARSLAAASPGELIEIRRILFETLRRLCADLGLAEGDVVRCRSGAGGQLLLETGDGRVVALERDWARFVQVADAAGGVDSRAPAA